MSAFRFSLSDSPAATRQSPGSGTVSVPRDAVARQIVEAVGARVVLVRAPAGFGKTTVMLQLQERLQAQGMSTAWLTLDRADNDRSRFLVSLGTAVTALGRGREPEARGIPRGPVPELAREGLPFALFLDDLELIQESAVLDVLKEVIAHLPRYGRLVIGSRSLPALGLGRLRALGQLLEIDTEWLRFSRDETAAFLRQRVGTRLSEGAISRLYEKTEGWAAALWLVSLALERRPGGEGDHFIESFSGSSSAVTAYLAEDVLARQPPEVRDFLMRTSVLRQLDPAACQALVPNVDCVRMLAHLQTANLFLTPVGDQPQQFRYHAMFADFLRGQLALEMPELLPRLHLAASGWYESCGRPVPTIDHAIEGGDFPHALALLEGHVYTFLEQGRMRLLARWFAAVPPELLRAFPLLQMAALWACALTRGPWEAMHLLQESGEAFLENAEVRAHVNALRPILLTMMDRLEEAWEVGRQSLMELPSCSDFADGALTNAMASVLSAMGEQREAHRLLDGARPALRDGTFNRTHSESLEGVIDLKEGRLRQATARLRIAVSANSHTASYYYNTSGNGSSGILYASVVYESNELDAVERLLNAYLPLVRDASLPDHVILGYRLRARLAFDRGDVDGLFSALTELECLGRQRKLARVVASARLERATLLLLQGNLSASKAELERADDPSVWERVGRLRLSTHDVDEPGIARLRFAIHSAEARTAALQAQELLVKALTTGRQYRAMKLRLLLALAWDRAGEPASAAGEMDELLRQTAREGFVRLIIDEGPIVLPLLQRTQRALDESPRPQDPIVADHVRELIDALGGPIKIEEAEAGRATVEELTSKEMRILQLLSEGYSNHALATRLFVSESTVRTHLRNINCKLDARSRTEAVAIARRLGMIR
jgi:LuxR family transcriptional regulator, maltose regulon positive regulatory protein